MTQMFPVTIPLPKTAIKERCCYTNCANSSEEPELDPMPDAHPAQQIQLTQFQHQQQHPYSTRL